MTAPAAPAATAATAPHTAPASRGGAPLAGAVLLALIVALQFGPLIGLVGYRFVDPEWARVALARDAFVLLLVLIALPSALGDARPWTASQRWAIATVVAYTGIALLSDAAPSVVLLNLRRLVILPLLFAAVLAVPWSRAQLCQAMRWLFASSVLVAVFGIAERIGPESLWTDGLRLVDYTAANPLDPFGAQPYYASGRYFSGDLERWTGDVLRRAISTYLEPTTLAAGMAAGLVLAVAFKRGAFAIAALALCGALTLSKGFVLFLPLFVLWRRTGLPSPRQVLLFCALAAAVALAAEATGNTDGPFIHLAGLATALRYLAAGNVFGEGIGEAGNYADDAFDVGAESGLGNVVGQVGVAALLLLGWISALAHEVLARADARRDAVGRCLAGWLLFWLLTFLYSASSLGVGGNAIGFLMLALYLHPAWSASRS